jgi:diguanylate cyclase (GGDEF)-like protein
LKPYDPLQRLTDLADGEPVAAEGSVGEIVEHFLHQLVEEVPYNNRILLVDDEQQNITTLKTLLCAEESAAQLSDEIAFLQQMFNPADDQQTLQPLQFQISSASSGDEAVVLAQRQEQAGEPFALAFVDMRMPNGMDGLETAKALRTLSPEIEIVVMTAWSDYSLEQIREVLGPHFTFMGKPFHQDDVAQRAVEGCAKWLSQKQSQLSYKALIEITAKMEGEIRRRKKLEKKLKRAALYDQLTGLPNRGLFNDHLHHALAHAQRSGKVLLVVFIDLDHFKQVNDQHGHALGDLLLKEVAETLQQQIREEDVPCRWAGDEFSLLMSGFSTLDDVEIVCGRLTAALNRPVELEGVVLQMGASIGVSCYTPAQHSSGAGKGEIAIERLASDLLNQADQAMYRAKARERGGYYIVHHFTTPQVASQL